MNPGHPTEPPVRFADAKEINPFQLLLDLHDHAVALTPESGLDDVLAELALPAAVVSWWTRWQPSTIHSALRAGADLTDITKRPVSTRVTPSGGGVDGLISRRGWTSANVRQWTPD